MGNPLILWQGMQARSAGTVGFPGGLAVAPIAKAVTVLAVARMPGP